MGIRSFKMFIIRKIGKLLRGNATPAQIMLATVLGMMLGFMPGLSAIGSIVILLCLLLVLNANLTLCLWSVVLGKILSLFLIRVSFEAGYFLLDGPLSGLYAGIINRPVLALMGLEYYVVSGGLLLGLIMGIVIANSALPLAMVMIAMNILTGISMLFYFKPQLSQK